tara:strand:+ start:71 stop:643 length:573 start_codon:yes stop_codon:yes gene_type:complete
MIILEGLKSSLVFEEQTLKGVYLISPDVYIDDRGYFFESFKEYDFKKHLNVRFVQDNEVLSAKVKTIRGLHYQIDNPQAKLIHVISGAIKDVIVDIRTSSSSFGKSFSINLDHKNHKMLFIPEGFAHGYLVLEENTIVHYKCTDYYNPKSEYGIRWDDSDININWGVDSPHISQKDSMLPFLKNQKILPK